MDFDPGARSLVLGQNASGKSSLVDALAWALTGRCRGTDGRGSGAADLVMHGTGEAVVSVQLAVDGHGMEIVRRYQTEGGMSCNVKDVPSALDTTAVALSSVIYGDSFFDLHHKDAKNLLLQLLNVTVKVATSTTVGNETTIIDETLTLQELDARHETWFTRRRDAKRDLQQHTVPEEPKVVQFDTGKHGTHAELTEKVTRTRSSLRGATAELTRMAAGLAEQRRELGLAENTVGKLADCQARLGAQRGMLKQVEQRIGDLPGPSELDDVAQLLRDKAGLAASIERLNRHEPGRGCVIDESIPCPVPASTFTATAGKRTTALEKLGRKIAVAEKKKETADRQAAALRELEQTSAYHTGQISDAEADIVACELAAKTIDDLRQDVEEAQAAQDAKDLEITTAQNDLAEIAGVMEQVVTHESRRQAWAQAGTDHDVLLDKVDRAEEMVQRLGPNGARATALQDALGTFLELLNGSLEYFGYSVELSVSPWSLRVRNDHAKVPEFVAFNRLSGGERRWTAMALQLALAEISGLGFCVIDNADTVVGQARRILTGVVMGSGLPQIVVCMAKSEDESIPAIPDVQVIQMTERTRHGQEEEAEELAPVAEGG